MTVVRMRGCVGGRREEHPFGHPKHLQAPNPQLRLEPFGRFERQLLPGNHEVADAGEVVPLAFGRLQQPHEDRRRAARVFAATGPAGTPAARSTPSCSKHPCNCRKPRSRPPGFPIDDVSKLRVICIALDLEVQRPVE